jgi:xanthine dehydrogenase accessory factor
MDWLAAVGRLRTRRERGVIVTLAAVRGHAPRNSGAKMVVSADEVSGSIGGGNLEATAVERARTMIRSGAAEPDLLTMSLSEKARAEYGVQCCGGEVTMLLEPIRVIPSVAIFGLGNVGYELAQVLHRHELELHLVDSRASMVDEDRLAPLAAGSALLHVHHAPIPETALPLLPAGTHVLIMTHDHAEDLALCDAALRSGSLASIGLIGSSAKWARFRTQLTREGHSETDLARIRTPIGLGGISAKEPAAIAVSVAAHLLMSFEASSASVARPPRTASRDPAAPGLR